MTNTPKRLTSSITIVWKPSFLVACQAGDADSSRTPGLTSVLQGSVNVNRGALSLVPQWQCIRFFCILHFLILFVNVMSQTYICIYILSIFRQQLCPRERSNCGLSNSVLFGWLLWADRVLTRSRDGQKLCVQVPVRRQHGRRGERQNRRSIRSKEGIKNRNLTRSEKW